VIERSEIASFLNYLLRESSVCGDMYHVLKDNERYGLTSELQNDNVLVNFLIQQKRSGFTDLKLFC